MSLASPRFRLAVVISHPTQYYSPWFRWLAAYESFELRVFYLWDFGVSALHDPQFGTQVRWDVDLLSGYDHEFVPNVAAVPGTEHFTGLRNPSLPTLLSRFRPDALLLFGYKYVTHLQTIFWARRQCVPLIFRGDSHFLGRPEPGLFKLLMLRLLYRQFAAFLPVGRANHAYFRRLDVPESRLHFSPHAVDTTLFDPQRADHRAVAATLSRELGLTPDTQVVLFAGKLVTAKQPRALLEAYFTARTGRSILLFVGDGEEKAALLAASAGADDVRFLPFANQSEMPARYLLADVFVLPSAGSYETWGLAVNEAMHMGVPAVVSDRVGCQADLVTPGETGWVFRSGDPADLRRVLSTAMSTLTSATARAEIHSAIAKRIKKYTYAEASAGLRAALQALPGAR